MSWARKVRHSMRHGSRAATIIELFRGTRRSPQATNGRKGSQMAVVGHNYIRPQLYSYGAQMAGCGPAHLETNAPMPPASRAAAAWWHCFDRKHGTQAQRCLSWTPVFPTNSSSNMLGMWPTDRRGGVPVGRAEQPAARCTAAPRHELVATFGR